MTVREVLGILTKVEEIYVDYGKEPTALNPKDEILVEAYGDYVVDSLYAVGENSVMIGLSVRPFKATHAILEDK